MPGGDVVRSTTLGLVIICGVSIAVCAPQAQTLSPTKPSEPNSQVHRTSSDRHDLEGVWNFGTITPLERPPQFADKPVLTDAEVKALEMEAAQQRVDPPADRKVGDTAEFGPGRAYNQFWRDPGSRVVGSKRTSLIVDPPDGRLPPLTPEANARKSARALAASRLENPEGLNNATRCLVGFNTGPPMIPGAYNNYVQIVQTAKNVVIFHEMAPRARVVALDGRAHGRTRQWQGDSTGRWEGDTLVIDTILFTDKAAFMDVADEQLHLTERLTRVDADTLMYRVTVDDPTVWTRAWTIELTMTRTDDQIYEYACHEANYAMRNTLSAARAGDKP